MYDVIVVGGGSAGSLLAGRLALETEAAILLIEGGSRDITPLVHIPSGYAKLLQYGWFLYPYETVPQTQLDGRPRALQQGKGLGGGSSINAMAYVRGQARDYAIWDAAAGGTGAWSYDSLLPHFRAMEGNDIFSAPFHGAHGPLKVSQPQQLSPLNQAVIKAFQEHGLAYNADYNGASQTGVGPCQLTIGHARRCSSAVAFLHPAQKRKNLTIVTNAHVSRVMLRGDQVEGVEYIKSGRTQTARAANVILSAGAINTPRLLMLSGIGSETELSKHGIPVQVRSDDVGLHLQDHPQVPVIARAKGPYGYSQYSSGLRMIAVGAQYLVTKTGPVASNGIESVSYFNPDDPSAEPTIQSFHSAVIADEGLGKPDPHPGITLENVVLQPKSRGTVRLRDADSLSMPLIDPNYLGDPEDMRKIIGGLRYAREVLSSPAIRDMLHSEREPGADLDTDAQLADYARRRLACMWHPVGTCRMGADDQSVVDPSLRVRGVRGLRVIDASIMPEIVSGNTNATTMAIASKGLELLMEDLRLTPTKIVAAVM